jgi:DNA-binding CsgD family transcriptional regulator
VTSSEADPDRERKDGEQHRCRHGRRLARHARHEGCACDDLSPREPSAENRSDGRGDEIVASNDRREAPLSASQLGETGDKEHEANHNPRDAHGDHRSFHGRRCYDLDGGRTRYTFVDRGRRVEEHAWFWHDSILSGGPAVAIALSGGERKKPGPPRRVTTRQLEVIALVAEGLPTKAIASQLGVSEAAVKKHLGHLMARYEVPNRAALVRAGIANGILFVPHEAATSLPDRREDYGFDEGLIS